jgi:hypothetical protein
MSGVRMRPRRFLAPSPTKSGTWKTPLTIFRYKSRSFCPLKGKLPHSSAYRSTPAAQMSAQKPEYSLRATISGAMYEGVPQKIFSFFPGGTMVENPKSMIFTVPLSSRSKFSSFTSR